MIHTPKKSRGKLKPRMVKLPKYEKNRQETKRDEQCRERHDHRLLRVISTVSHLVGRSWSTVENFLHRYYKRGTVENLPRTGRPEILTKRDKQTILCAARKNRQYTLEQVRRIYAPHVSLPTIDRMLRPHNIKKWLAKKRPKLTAYYAKARLQWALAHKDCTVEDFRRVIYSDECSVEKEPAGHQRWVFQTPQEKWHNDCTKTVFR
jgi:hypothetical protein